MGEIYTGYTQQAPVVKPIPTVKTPDEPVVSEFYKPGQPDPTNRKNTAIAPPEFNPTSIDNTSQDLIAAFKGSRLGSTRDDKPGSGSILDFKAYQSLPPAAKEKLVGRLMQTDDKAAISSAMKGMDSHGFEKLVKQFQFNYYSEHGTKLGRNGEVKVGQLADGMLGEKTFYALFCTKPESAADTFMKGEITKKGESAVTVTDLESLFKTSAPPVKLTAEQSDKLLAANFISGKDSIELVKKSEWSDKDIKNLLEISGLHSDASNIEAFTRYLNWHNKGLEGNPRLIVPSQDILDAFKTENFDNADNDKDYDVKATDDDIRRPKVETGEVSPITNTQIAIARKMVRKVSAEHQQDGLELVKHSGILPALEKLQNTIRQIPGHENYELQVLSGYRDPSYNKRVGGADHSQHMQGKAADIVIPSGMSISEFFKIVETVPDFRQGGVGLYRENGFIHMDVRDGVARW